MHPRIRQSSVAFVLAALLVASGGEAVAAPAKQGGIRGVVNRLFHREKAPVAQEQVKPAHDIPHGAPPPAAFRAAWRKGDVAELADSVETPAHLAAALRFKADQMTRVIAKATGPNADPHAQRYVKENLHGDLTNLLDALGDMQEKGGLDATTEARAMAAASRVLHAASQADVALTNEPKNQTEHLLSGALYKQRVNHHDTAIEVEAGMTRGILAAMTTRDGTVGPVLADGGRPPPAFLAKKAGNKPIESVLWDDLSATEQLDLLKSQSKGHDFFSNRSMPGVMFRPNAGKALMSKVEYLGPASVESVNGVELHVRQPGTASNNQKDSLETAAAIGATPLSRHQHVPNKIPQSILKGNAVDRFRLVDFYRRANITADLASVLEGYSLKPNRDGHITYFDYMKAGALPAMNKHLFSVATTGRGTLGPSTLKMGSVGFRTGSLYKDETMFGFEMRTLSKTNSEEKMRFGNAVQKGVLTGSYGTPRATIEEWHDKVIGTKGSPSKIARRQGEVLSGLHFNRDTDTLLAEPPQELMASLTPNVRRGMREKADEQYSLKLLVHDWSKDPVISSQPGLAATIVTAQKAALAKLDKDGFESNMGIIKTFVKDSGLYDVYSESLGMRESIAAP